nr:MAG TPA: AAA domain protein [Caudoviricetes sp.]
MKFQKAKKEQIWLKLLLAGPSGSGKSYSALRLATGIAKASNGKIAAIDTEAGRIKYYANEFDFDVLQLDEPYEPEKYIEAIDEAVKEGYNTIIIDSITHEWNYCLQLVDKIPGTNTYTKWAKITPRHDSFREKILQAPAHIIATVRGKDAYVLEQDSKGKQVPKKVGLGYTQRDGLEFEYTVTFNIDQNTHTAEVTKDNTHLFENKYEKLTEDDGVSLYEWANSGEKIENKPTKVEKKNVIPTTVEGLQTAIIAKATELGGSSNKEMLKLFTDIIGTKNPNSCDDINKLTELLNKLREGGKVND